MLMLIRALRAFYLALGGFASATLLSLIGAVLAPYTPGVFTLALELVVLGAGLTAVSASVGPEVFGMSLGCPGPSIKSLCRKKPMKTAIS